MKRTRFTDEQLIGILAGHETGAKCADLCCKHGMSEGMVYDWKAKVGGMTVSEAKRLKTLEDANAKLKKLLAERRLDFAAMKGLASKSGDACREAGRGRASEGQVRAVREAGVADCTRREDGSAETAIYDVVRQPGPVVIAIAEALPSGGQVFGLRTRKTAVILRDGGPFLEGLDVGDHEGLRHPGSLIWSTMDRFCSSQMPAE